MHPVPCMYYFIGSYQQFHEQLQACFVGKEAQHQRFYLSRGARECLESEPGSGPFLLCDLSQVINLPVPQFPVYKIGEVIQDPHTHTHHLAVIPKSKISENYRAFINRTAGHVLIRKHYPLFLCNSNLTGHPVFSFVKFSNTSFAPTLIWHNN